MVPARMGPTAGAVGSAIILALGVYIAVSRTGTDLATFGWLLGVVGALTLGVNLVLRARMRRRD